MPKKVKKKREITREDGTNEGWEEYFDYIYPDEQNAQPLKVCVRDDDDDDDAS